MEYSPKLKKAMVEIEAILKREQIAGSVILHTPGHGEHLLHINPNYSCAKIDHIKQEIKITAKASDFDGDVKKRNKCLADTSNMFRIMAELVGSHTLMLIDTSTSLDKALNSDHSGTGYSSHNQQNN